jgi:hypothetical protein
MSTMDNKEEAKMWMKKPKLDDNRIKIGEFFYIHNVDECRNILLHYNILCSQLSFTTNMKKRTLLYTTTIRFLHYRLTFCLLTKMGHSWF